MHEFQLILEEISKKVKIPQITSIVKTTKITLLKEKIAFKVSRKTKLLQECFLPL